MAISEFELIRRFFSAPARPRADVLLGVGDDCALLCVPEGRALAVSLDTLVEGRHFPADTPAQAVGHKALAVGLSDLAAMGAEPAWMTLSLSLPEADEGWLRDFARGLFELAAKHEVQLVGGDTVRGPRVITLQLHGFVPAARALRRGGARPGDGIYVTGTPGDAGLGLALALGQRRAHDAADETFLRARLERPEPRVAAGLALRDLASAAIDVSDGLAADLTHILEQSGVGARIELERLPCSEALRRTVALEDDRWRYGLAAGDDYELCFTVPPAHRDEVDRLCSAWPFGCRRIGQIEAEPGLRLVRAGGQAWRLDARGFDHFAHA